jgi:NAD(P)-dependent dehydrogenase (short-subunit alcohol dehydrogenase family)
VLCAPDEERLVASKIDTVRVMAVPADLSVPAGADRRAATVEHEFGGADILINNADGGRLKVTT